MLDGLDQIPWSTLEHAYGDAGDIPNLIRALVSRDPDERGRAQEMLEWGPFHQGSLYSCTPFVVRFLLQLAQEHNAHDQPWMLQYVSRVLASALYFLPSPENLPDAGALASDSEATIAEQVVFEIRPHLPALARLLDDPNGQMRLALLRLLVLLKADLPHLDTILEEKLRGETQESLRGALVFCLSLVADDFTASPTPAMLEKRSESPLVQIAAGFGIIATLGDAIPDSLLKDFCGVIADNYDALEKFEEIYAEYLTPLGAPQGKDRLLDCLRDELSTLQKGQIVQALSRIYAQLPTVPSFGTRVGYAYYLGAMVSLAFPQGKLPPETTIRDLNATQCGVLEAFQQYDMPAIEWNVYGPDDYRMVLGFNFRSEADFLDFMLGKRSARQST